MAERLCQKRALEAFGLDPAKWGGKVQSSMSLLPDNNYISFCVPIMEYVSFFRTLIRVNSIGMIVIFDMIILLCI